MTLNLLSVIRGERDITRIFQILFASTDTYVTGGFTVDFTKAVNTPKAPRGSLPVYAVNSSGSNLPPQVSRVTQMQSPGGYTAELIQNTASPTIKNYLLKIWDIAGAAQLAASGIPSGIYNDVNGFTFSFITPKKLG